MDRPDQQKDEEIHEEAGKKKKHGIIKYRDTIGPYSIKKTIGEGAFSIVKLAYNELFFKYYACKIVPIQMLKERDLYKRFELEIRISQLMRHPGVAAITDVLKDENNFYIFMEYYPNGNLLDYIVSKKRLTDDEAKGLIYQIFDGLEYIHKQNVSHRDLKPENIMIDNIGHLRISDFGLSRFVDNDHLAKTPCGSPCYVSPECVSGKNYDGLISDIWSCGVILYAMVTGMLPWTKRKMSELFHQIRHGEYKIPQYVSQQCANLIQMLLTVDPEKRITLEEAKHHTWFNIPVIPEETYMNYTIPQDYLKKMDEKEKNNDASTDVPYLSTRKVDIYFRPDIDYDFDRQFNEISNIHAIDNSSNQTKCDVSSPNLKFENTVKIISDTQKKPTRIRRRVAFNKDVQSENKEQNLGLDTLLSKSRIYIYCSTGKIEHKNSILSDKIASSILVKDKSQGDLVSDTKDNNKNEDSRQNEQQSAKSSGSVLTIQPQKSAKLPPRLY